jgi:hypothetical protein
MKQQVVPFKKPVKILQVFRMIHEYGKEERSFAGRKEKLEWKDMQSSNGFVADGTLYLPESVQQEKDFESCHLITIEDDADAESRDDWKLIKGKYSRGNNHCFNLGHPRGYEIFRLHGNPLAVSLHYNYSYIGHPSRDNFTLATLEPNEAVEIKINGKLDTSRGRYYKEQQFIFLLLGQFSSCHLLPANPVPVVKSVPRERKLVNLLKPLW